MALERIEVGLVSADRDLVDFFAAVFEMEELPALEFDPGVLYRLQAPGAVIKVMVPAQPPTLTEPIEPFIGAIGLRYLTMFVGDLDGVLERAATRGGKLQHGPLKTGPGTRVAVLQDPDGNAIEVVEAP